MNWNILLTSGKQIKRDSASSENERGIAYQVKWSTYLFEYKGEPSSKAKYDI